MYFKLSKQAFFNSLSIASRAISSFSPLPAFSGIKIEAKEDRLTLTGSDSDISIQTSILKSDEDSLVINDKGSIVIESKYILEIVRKIDSEHLEFEVIDGSLTKICGETAEFKINGMKASEYPMIDFTCPSEKFEMSAETLKHIISQTSFATSVSETRPVLTGVNFNCADKLLQCVGTDSYRLAKKTIELENDCKFNITVPSRNLAEVAKTLDLNEMTVVAVSDKKVQFIIDNTIIQTRLIDGVYPDTSRLIPLEFAHELVIDAQELIGAIDRASFIKNDGVSVIKLSLSQNECVLSTRSQEVGSSIEKLKNAQYVGDKLEISFNGRYVFEALKAIQKGSVRFSFGGEMKPFIIQSIEDKTALQLVLPVRTYA